MTIKSQHLKLFLLKKYSYVSPHKKYPNKILYIYSNRYTHNDVN